MRLALLNSTAAFSTKGQRPKCKPKKNQHDACNHTAGVDTHRNASSYSVAAAETDTSPLQPFARTLLMTSSLRPYPLQTQISTVKVESRCLVARATRSNSWISGAILLPLSRECCLAPLQLAFLFATPRARPALGVSAARERVEIHRNQSNF